MLFQSFDGLLPYENIFTRMRAFTQERALSPDEVWFLEHQPVFTQGQAGKPEHILNPQNIPVVQSDRGGQVTYHGPGQLMVYVLLNIRQLELGPRTLVSALENIIIDLLSFYELEAHAKPDAPGVYLEDGSKIASIGLRITKGCSYHGISFNHTVDLAPFNLINPCGFKNLKVARLSDYRPEVTRADLEQHFKSLILQYLCPTREESLA